MGHERVGGLPRTRPWIAVVSDIAELKEPSVDGVRQIAQATLKNVSHRFGRLNRDSGVKAAFKFLVALTKAPDPLSEGGWPEIQFSSGPSPLRLSAHLSQFVRAHGESLEYADVAAKAGASTIGQWSRQQSVQRTLFEEGVDASAIWQKASTGGGFCEVARLFFSSFTEKYLSYFLEREASASLPGIHERDRFQASLSEHIETVSQYAFETSRITQSFAAGWYNNNARDRLPTDEQLQAFLGIAFGKVREELVREQGSL